HQAGDEVLIEVAQRLTGIVRSCDTVARMGGDEFTLILEAFHTIEDISPILQKLEDQFAKPISTHKGEVTLTLSIGASCYPHDATNHKVLLHNADVALYDVKTHGRNDVRCFHQLEKLQEP
ncbi:MAG: GGDEF domain-containing protein, partial [Pseudomonadota bacterium]|nr:GGDEF domain-containing protein [Pseudomonadota bacterium]